MVSFKNIALSCAAVFAAVATPAMAESTNKLVHYHDLDLSSPKDQKRFQTRVKSAVRRVCGIPQPFTLVEKLDRIRCEAEAKANAMPKAERTIARYQDADKVASNKTVAVIGN